MSYPTFISSEARQVVEELERARTKFPGKFNSMHEGYAVILEELDEAWAEIKADNPEAALAEMVQVTAMALRFLEDCAVRMAKGEAVEQ